jgi:(2R)-3-sulfolactate dehydrogenase (NADP+)
MVTPAMERPKPGLVLVDAAHGFAYPAIELAETVLPEAAHSQGVVSAAIRRSHHCGAAGHPVERLAQAGLVAMLFSNTPYAMAPWGGSKPVFGTNPLAFACPLPGRAPLVVDLSLSKVARGNIVTAKQRGEKIPEGWALDEHGKPTTDPDAALRGTMVPAGDAKGTALALMVELLAAGMTGSNYAADASSFLDTKGGPPGVGQLIIAFDPKAFGGNAVERFGVLAQSIEEQAGARLPGMRRLQARTKSQAEGLTVSDALMAEIEAA